MTRSYIPRSPVCISMSSKQQRDTHPNNGIFPQDFDLGLYNALVKGYELGKDTKAIVEEYNTRLNNE